MDLPPNTTPGSSPRRPGDDPFLPEQELLWWLPRAAVLVGIVGAIILLALSAGHRRQVQLAAVDGAAVLQRGALAPVGWTPWVPDGAVDAWAPVLWPEDGPAAPLDGELRLISDTFAGMLRRAARGAAGDVATLEALATQEEAFGVWYAGRFDGDGPPGAGEVAALLAAARVPRGGDAPMILRRLLDRLQAGPVPQDEVAREVRRALEAVE